MRAASGGRRCLEAAPAAAVAEPAAEEEQQHEDDEKDGQHGRSSGLSVGLTQRYPCRAVRRRPLRQRPFGYTVDVTASESGERPVAEGLPPADPGPDSAAREERLRERESARDERPQGMVPGRDRRRTKVERGFMRIIATGGIIGIAVVLGAVLVGQDVAGWIVGLVIGLTSVILAALLWSSRQL